ncbi:hypothetical protein L9F63_020605, partial [Diploptera punctata]
VDAVASRCQPHGLGVMLLLILCLVLVQGTLQQPQTQEISSHHGGLTPAEYQTAFSCEGRVAGYYADIESGCQLYHLCDVDGRRSTHSCPNATLFQQRMMICDHWYMVDCNKSVHDYNANLLIGQRDKPFLGNGHIHPREPVKSFSAHHNPGTLQQPNWFPTVGGRPGRVPENANIIPQQVSSIHFTYTPPPANVEINPPAQKETKYKNINADQDSSRQSTSRSEQKITLVPVPQYRQKLSRDNEFNNSIPETPTLRPRTSTHQQTLSQSQRQGRHRNLNTRTNVDNSRQSNPTHRDRGVAPHHERRLPDAYTNNPFFQSLINRSTAQQHNASEPKHQEKPVKLEDIANVRVSNIQTVKVFENHDIQNISPNSRDQKSFDSYSNNPFLQPSAHEARIPPDKYNIGENEEDLNNVLELHILDPRHMFYIPQSKNHETGKRNSTVLFISVPTPLHNNSHGIMHFRNDVRIPLKGTNPECPRCHPAFLNPGKCQPCVIIR